MEARMTNRTAGEVEVIHSRERAVQIEAVPGPDPERVRRLVQEFLRGRSPRTIEAYRRDLEAFAKHIGVCGPAAVEDAARWLFARSHGEANEVALHYRNAMVESGKAPASVNRAMAALRSLVGLARTLGVVPWALTIRGVKASGMRDTRGPAPRSVRDLVRALASREDPRGVRDHAIVRCTFDLALRRGEIASLDLEHVDLEGRRIAILGKGRTAREWRTLPDQTRDALAAWLAVRGSEPGPLFTNRDHRTRGSRLTGVSIWRVVRDAGAAIGVRTWPHALRHASVTTALDVTNGDVRRVQRFSRHANPTTVLIYDDTRRDDPAEIARLVARTV